MIKNYKLVPNNRVATKSKWSWLASLLLVFGPILLMGQSSAPNCVSLNLAISSNDSSSFTVRELVTNSSVAMPVTLRVEGDFGNTIFFGTNLNESDVIDLHACNFRNRTLRVTVNNSIGQCWGNISFKFSSGYNLQSNLDTAVWCIDPLINLDPNDFYDERWYTTEYPYTLLPTAFVPCGEDKILEQLFDVDRDGDLDRRDARSWYAPRFEECEYRAIDWPRSFNCDQSDSAKVIIREWEAFNKDGVRSSTWDTIRVIKLPDLSEGGYLHAPQKDTVTCSLETKVTKTTKPTYLCWKQLVGLHTDGTYIFYPKSYIDNIIADVTDAAGIARLQQITVAHDKSANRSYNIYQIAGLPVGTGYYGEVSYLFRVGTGDQFLSNAGAYIEANSDWFYQANEHGFWVDICIPSVEVCTWEETCDVWPVWDCEDGVRLILPSSPYDATSCKLFCLSNDLIENTKCFTTIHSESKELGYNCPRVVRKHFSIKQLCFAEGTSTLDDLSSCSLVADPSGIISSDDNGAHSTIEIEQWKVYIDTIGPLYIDEYGYDNVFTWSAGTHDCFAEVTIPKIKAKDECSGVKYVKAKLPGLGWTNLELDDDGYWVHPKSARTYRLPCGVYEVTYELADNCHNVRSISPTYVKVVDNQAPTVITQDNIRVSLGGKTAWVDAVKFDGGSVDNCSIRMILARRTDWKEGCGVNLCNSVVADFQSEADMDDYISRYGLTSVLRDGGDIEGVYADQYEWLRDDGEWCDRVYYDHYYNQYDNTSHFGDCSSTQTGTYRRESSSIGNYILDGWEYDIKSYWAKECASTDDHGNPIEIRENQLAATIGGGWGQKVPFCCEDACEDIVIEVLVIDKECNYSKGWVTVTVEDKSSIANACEFDEITISCNSYNKYYKEAIDAAIAAGNNSETAEEEFKAVDNLLGDLLKGWRGDDGETLVDSDGNELAKKFTYRTSECKYNIESRNIKVVGHDGSEEWVTVYDTTVVFEEVEKQATKGGVYRLCGASCKQDIWVNLNSCGVGTITRRWAVRNGCGDHDPTPLNYEQVIYVQSSCDLNKHMFDIPQDTTICVEKISFDAESNVIANAGSLEYLLDDLSCRQLGYGYTDQLFSIAGDPDTYKLHRTWRINDWCNSDHLTCLQKVVLEVGSCGTDTSASRSRISGTIYPSYDENGKVGLVNVSAIVNGADENVFTTSDAGTFEFDLPEGSSVRLVPAKNTKLVNGVTIGDIIEIQRHIIQSDVISDPFELVAADVNNDGIINSKDILSIRRVSLRRANEFPNNSSWRFFEAQTGEESYTISTVADGMAVNFVGVKIGDVDNEDVDASRSSKNILFTANETDLAEGESFPLQLTTSADLVGYQFAIKYNPELLEIESISGADMTSENWNSVKAGEILVSYNGSDASNLVLNVVAKTDVDLSEALTISSVNGFDAMAVLANLDKRGVDISFSGDYEFELFQNRPNPVHDFTNIKFSLPEAMEAKLSFYDISGKVLKVIERNFEKGINSVNIGSEELGVSGVVYFQLDTYQHTSTKRMVLIQ